MRYHRAMKELKNHVLFQDADAVKKACSRLACLSIEGFFFMRRFSDSTFVDLSNQLAWSESFLTRYLNCKIDLKSAQDHASIGPGISLWSHNLENAIWQEGRAEWGFYSGISIAKQGPRWTDLFCYYSRKEPSEMDRSYLKNFYLLDKFSLQFIDTFHTIIQKGERAPLAIPKGYVRNIPCDQDEGFEPLSARELECIYYIAKGNTAAQVGKLLHISRRTVETHLQKAKEKRFVHKTSDLIKLYPEW
jgi:LuxR family transcriptional regulator, quorum-sensing system regulator SolR